MTNKDAIEWIKDIQVWNWHKAQRYQRYYAEAFPIAIEALEKQIPKKPKLDDEMGFFECPSCGGIIGYMDDPKDHKYCLMCGQALDWEDLDKNETNI